MIRLYWDFCKTEYKKNVGEIRRFLPEEGLTDVLQCGILYT